MGFAPQPFSGGHAVGDLMISLLAFADFEDDVGGELEGGEGVGDGVQV